MEEFEMSEKQDFASVIIAALDLPGVEIDKIKRGAHGEFLIYTKSTDKDVNCHRCGKKTKPYGSGRELTIKHLPILGEATHIIIKPPRGICPHCDKNPTTSKRYDWHDEKGRYTKAYEKHVMLSLVNSTISDVSVKEVLSYHIIQSIIDRNIESKTNWNKIKKITLLGIDEISLKKGYQDFVTIITSRNDEKTQILGVIKGKEKAAVKGFLAKIPVRLKKTVVGVCCDMCDAYCNAAAEVFGKDIPIIVDRFHVARLYRKSLVALRKKELVRLRKELSEEQYQSLKSAIAILRRNKEFVTSEEKKTLKRLFKYSPTLKVAHKLCCKLTGIYNSKIGIRSANKKINAWIQLVEESGLTCFNNFVKTLKKWKAQIINYFRRRETSGFVEGFNNKVKVLKRRCYGIFDIKHLFQRLFLDTAGYDLFLKKQIVGVL
jgi:transposase